MSTPAVTTDPYAAYGGKISSGGGADPYAAYGGSVAAPAAAAPDTRNSFQRGVDELARYVGHPEDRGAGQPNAANRFGEGIVQGALSPLAHPLDALSSAAQSFLHPIDTATAMAHSAAQNPAGFAGQLVGGAALGEGAGAVAAPVADVLAKGAGRVVLLGKTPAEAYESALKPSTTLSQPERAAIVQTGLDNRIPISKPGLEKLGDKIANLNQQIKDVISTDPTRPIDPNAVATRADLARAKFAKQVNAQPDLNAIEASRQQFLSEQGAKPGVPAIPPRPTGLLDAQGNPIMSGGTPAKPPTPAPPMNASDAQTMKQGTYQVLKSKYGEQGSASTEAQKALARGLKEEIATQFPEIGTLNANESRLLDLQPVLERAVNRISNHQLIGIGTPVAGAAADAVAGPGVGRVAMVLKAVLDNPNVKSRLAISLSKGAKIPYAQAAARVGAYSAALASDSGSTPYPSP
jgi:hypothetical protein